MNGRGEAAATGAKLDILRALLDRNANITELALATCTGRTTVSRLILELEASGAVERVDKRDFALAKEICFTVMELYRDRAEIFTYYVEGKRAERKTLRFVASMSFEGNVARSVSLAERYLDSLKSNGYRAYSATMTVNCIPDIALPEAFSKIIDKKAALEHCFELSDTRGSCIYWDISDGNSYLYVDGKYVSGKDECRLKDANMLDMAFSLFSPELLIIEGADSELLSAVLSCGERNSVRVAAVSKDELSFAERGMIFTMLEKLFM